MLMKWGLNLGWAPVMQIKKGAQNLRSWVHRMLSSLSVGPKCPAVNEALQGFNVPTRLASLSWADQQWKLTGDAKPRGTAVPSLKAGTFAAPLQHRECIPSPGALGMMPQLPNESPNKCSCHQFSNMSSSKSHQLPTPNPCPFPNQHLPSPLRSLSPWASLQSQFIKQHLQCFMPVPRAHGFGACSAHFLATTVRWAEPKVGLPTNCSVPCSSALVCWITHGRMFWSLQGNCGKKTEVH